jgi:Flp pilus assembly protein TadG
MFQCSKTMRKGATAVEFAIVGPIFLTLVFGIFEFGRGFMVQHLLSGAARQACRYAIIPGRSTSAIQSLASNTLTGEGISGSTTTVFVNEGSGDASAAQSNDEITVTISVPVSKISIVPTGGFLTGSLSGQCTMRRE